jgi:hypothetical protein
MRHNGITEGRILILSAEELAQVKKAAELTFPVEIVQCYENAAGARFYKATLQHWALIHRALSRLYPLNSERSLVRALLEKVPSQSECDAVRRSYEQRAAR